jgi:hypothetical protein
VNTLNPEGWTICCSLVLMEMDRVCFVLSVYYIGVKTALTFGKEIIKIKFTSIYHSKGCFDIASTTRTHCHIAHEAL